MMMFGGTKLAIGLALRADPLAWIMAALIVFVVVTVGGYSRRHMAGDRNQRRYALATLLLGVSILIMVFADRLWVMLAGWGISNLLLVRLMVHKPQWRAARNAGTLALKTLGVGFAMLVVAFWLLSREAGTASLSAVLAQGKATGGHQPGLALALITVAAMTQSAIWPFHRWLLSSLNSPTPVSALMHAGLVNGGGFLLVRFAPLFLADPAFLDALFAVGLVTALLGTSWKLIQTDYKRMLACSTMGQMGFMVMQCGMGLFAPAVSHLCWHGLFKAYLFLSTGATVREKRRRNPSDGITPGMFGVACLFGMTGAYAFALTSGNPFRPGNTGGVLLGLAFMAATQLACNLLGRASGAAGAVLALAVSFLTGLLYGANLRLIETALAPLGLLRPQPLNGLYLSGFAVMVLVWLAMNMNVVARLQNCGLWQRLYMMLLNGAQPHPSTITATRTAYNG